MFNLFRSSRWLISAVCLCLCLTACAGEAGTEGNCSTTATKTVSPADTTVVTTVVPPATTTEQPDAPDEPDTPPVSQPLTDEIEKPVVNMEEAPAFEILPMRSTILDSLGSINSIPKADQSAVGRMVALTLENSCFYYYEYPSGAVQRIITVEPSPVAGYGRVILYRVDVEGVDELKQTLDQPIAGEIVAIAHISLQEATDLLVGIDAMERLNEEELVKGDGATDNPNSKQWYFSIQGEDAKVIALGGNTTKTGSNEQIYHTRMIQTVLGRYDLVRHLYDGLVPPGTLRDVSSIEQAEQTDVGKTVSLILGDKVFYYFIDRETDQERLMILESVEFAQNLGRITVYETALGGLDGLLKGMDKAFDAKILAVSNISWEEYNSASTTKQYMDYALDSGELSSKEVIGLTDSVKHPATLQWYCTVREEGNTVALLSNLTDSDSAWLNACFERIDSILYRFDLAPYL